MGYLHINNLYRDQRILLFRRCFAMEKVHGTSAHLSCSSGELKFFSGGESHERFVALFNHDHLKAGFELLGHPAVVVYGEAYGGKQQGMSRTYGPELRFIVFDVQIGDSWLDVPRMDAVARGLGLDVVPWREVSTDLSVLDAERDRPSEVAAQRGMGDDKKREGVVLRPLIELIANNGERIITKHKRDEFRERATPQKVIDPAQLQVLAAAEAIANEWVTDMRLTHVLQRLAASMTIDITVTLKVIEAMVEDVYREAAGEIVESKEARTRICQRTAQLFKTRLQGAVAG